MTEDDDIINEVSDLIDDYSILQDEIKKLKEKRDDIKNKLIDLYNENGLEKVSGSTHYASWGSFNRWDYARMKRELEFDEKYKIKSQTLYVRKLK